MTEIGLYTAMGSQRAVRRLRPDPIPDDVIARIFKAASCAPSGGNRQGWRMIAVRDPAAKARLGELYASQWTPYADEYRKVFAKASEAERVKQQRTIAAGDYMAAHLFETPLLMIVCFNPIYLAVTDAKQNRVSVVGGGSIYPAVQNLLLACRAEGLGCVLTTLLCAVEPEVKQLLSIPADWWTAAMIPIGYPVGQGYGPINRKPVGELFYSDSWGKAHT